jgi:hypothetical protein
MEGVVDLVFAIVNRLHNGQRVVVHCKSAKFDATARRTEVIATVPPITVSGEFRAQRLVQRLQGAL